MQRLVLALMGALVLSSCAGGGGQMSLAHRQTLKTDARIVVLPVSIPTTIKEAKGQGPLFASLYATELLRSYPVLEWERFERTLQQRNLAVDSLLAGAGETLAHDLGVDGLLLSEVYDWKPGKPGFWILAKSGRVGFQARLIDVASGSVLWSVNRVGETEPSDTLPVGLTRVFRKLADEMPRELTPQ